MLSLSARAVVAIGRNSFLTLPRIEASYVCATHTQSAGRGLVLPCRSFRLDAAHTQARLVLAAETAQPGDTVLAGVQLRMDPRWHTYWRNPGASGMATKIEWQLPPGVTAGATQWPVPEKLPDEDLTTYIYTNEVVLLVPLKLAADVAPRSARP